MCLMSFALKKNEFTNDDGNHMSGYLILKKRRMIMSLMLYT